jgi:hypothetical protein
MNVSPKSTSTQRLSPWEPGSGGTAGGVVGSGPLGGIAEGPGGRGGRGGGGGAQMGAGGPDAPRVILRFPANADDMLLSGVLVGGENLANRAQVVDAPLGSGHVVMFAIRPYWRYQTQGTFFMGFNAIMNWNDLNAGR